MDKLQVALKILFFMGKRPYVFEKTFSVKISPKLFFFYVFSTVPLGCSRRKFKIIAWGKSLDFGFLGSDYMCISSEKFAPEGKKF